MLKDNLLKLNLQFFAADTGGGGEGGTGDGTGGDDWVDVYFNPDNGTGNGTDSKDKDDKEADGKGAMIPKSRFDKVNGKYKDLADSHAATKAAYDKMAEDYGTATKTIKDMEAQIAESGNRIESLEGVVQTLIDAELEGVDEDVLELIPSDKTVEDKLEWIVKAKQKGLLTSKGFEIQIGQPSGNPAGGKGANAHDGMNPIQMMTMAYTKFKK